jgi:hypothetical protein
MRGVVTWDRARFADLAEAPPPGWAGDPREWQALHLHAVEGLPYRAVGARLGVTGQRAYQLACRAATRLGAGHDELAVLPPRTRRVLQRAGYLTRRQVAWATDAELLAVPRLGKRGLRAVRAAIPPAGEVCPTCGGRGRI